MSDSRNSTIANNTVAMYIRMLLLMFVSLYTSRVVLNTLGVEDFGIYNVVGGVIVMVSFIRITMSGTIQRFIAYELGKKEIDESNLPQVFNASITVLVAIGLIIVLLTETVGVWFLNNKLNIPPDRMGAANWVLQCSMLTVVLNLLSVPYNALIIAHEKMKVYAYISIIEAILKLLMVYSLFISPFDKLKTYAVLSLVLSVGLRMMYQVYCVKKFGRIKYKFAKNIKSYSHLLSMSGWTMFGAVAAVSRTQGVNIVLNMFFSAVVNAAQGIAEQVNGALTGFVTNFQTALNPQLYKSHAIGDGEYFHSLIYRGSKFSYFLLLLLGLPLIIEMNYVLELWLKNVPDYAIIFCRLVLINALIDSLSGPLITAMMATGKIRNYQIVTGLILFSALPLAYIIIRLGAPPQGAVFASILTSVVALFSRLIFLRKTIKLSIKKFASKVIFNVLAITFMAVIIPYLTYISMDSSLLRLVAVTATSFSSSAILIFFYGLNKTERSFISDKISGLKSKIFVNGKK